MTEPLNTEDPSTVGPYRLLGRLGAGGMGHVYLGESASGRRVAVKVVRPEIAGDPGFRRRFGREVDLALKAGGFWTAPVVDADADAPLPWVASQYVPGPSLTEHVANQGTLDERQLRKLGAGLAEALAAFHRMGLVHRDLKPSNILLLDDGPRVIDFGISKALETADGTDLTVAGTVMGTPGFMSPEQATGETVGSPSDIFSFASVLAFAATGRGPFGEGTTPTLLYRVVHQPPDLTGVPEGLRPLLAECLEKDPLARPVADGLAVRLFDSSDETTILYNAASAVPRAGDPVPTEPAVSPEPVSSEPPRDSPSVPDARHPEASPGSGHPVGAPAPRLTGAPEPRESVAAPAAALSGLSMAGGGPAVFWQRLRMPVLCTLVIFAGDIVTNAVGGDTLALPVLEPLVFLWVLTRLPALARAGLEVSAQGLTARRRGETVRIGWQDVTQVRFVGKKPSTALTVTAILHDTAPSIPRVLCKGTDDEHTLRCRLDLRTRSEVRTRSRELHEALRTYAGEAFKPEAR